MRYAFWMVVCLFLSQDIEAQPGQGAATEQPRLGFLSRHEAKERAQLYLFDGAQPEALVRLNGPLPEGCPGQSWYQRITRFLVAEAEASISDPLAGCFRGIFSFRVTPDGRHVLYTAETTKLNFHDLHLVRVNDPGHSVVINKPQQEQHIPYVAAISPDSQSFVYFGKSDSKHARSLYLVDISDPRRQQRLAEAIGEDDNVVSARFSPDGSKIAFVRIRGNAPLGEILLVTAAQPSQQPVSIANDFDVRSGRYEFSAHGSHLIYNSQLDASREPGVVLVDTAEGNTVAIDRRPNSIIVGVRLSPNRRFLFYSVFELSTRQADTQVVDLATFGIPYYSEAELTQMPTARQDYTMPFAPDSRTLIGQTEHDDRSKNLYRFSVADPSERIPVSPMVPRYDFGYGIVFTPDSQTIIYRANLEGQGPYGGLYLSALNRPTNAVRLSVTAEQRVHSFALSLDGEFVAYVAEDGDPSSAQERKLYLVDLLSENHPIKATESASTPLAHDVLPFGVEFLPPGPGYRE